MHWQVLGSGAFRAGPLPLCGCQDLQLSGAPLVTILAMGEWRSRAVTKYLDLTELEKDVALEAAMLSDQEEWID